MKYPKELQWNKCSTLSEQTVHGQTIATEFLWATDVDGNIWIKSKRTSQKFSKDDYQAMISYVLSSYDGVPLGSRRDKDVPENSVGALMERRMGNTSIRGWCSHLAAIAVKQNHFGFTDKGRGPGRGIHLHSKKLN